MSTLCEFNPRITVQSPHFTRVPSFDFGDFTSATNLTMGNPYVKVIFTYLILVELLNDSDYYRSSCQPLTSHKLLLSSRNNGGVRLP